MREGLINNREKTKIKKMSGEKDSVEMVAEIKYGSFLKDLVVDVKAIESSGKWQNLLVSGQDSKMKKEPFLFGKVKRSFQVPLQSVNRGGGITPVLDNIERINIKKYMLKYSSGMTEQEFFEEELGVDLNYTLPTKENFWRTDKVRGRVTLTKAGLTLNLRRPLDMLKYKILLVNSRLISPSYEERKLKATYEFMIVEQGKMVSKRVEQAEITSKAYSLYARITSSLVTMIEFHRSQGNTLPANYDEKWLKSEVLNALERDNVKFIATVEDPLYKKKIFVQKGVEAKAILRMNEKRYVLDNGVELGDLFSTIQWLNDPEHQEALVRIKSRIEMFEKGR